MDEDVVVGVDALRASLASAAGRFGALLRSAGDPDRPVPGSSWTVAEVGAHLVGGTTSYSSYLAGSTAAWADLSDLPGGSLAASNARNVAEVAERDLVVLAGTIEANVDGLVAATAGRDGAEPVFWHGRHVPLTTFLASAVAELLVHGRDVAVALDRPWPIAADDARQVILGLVPLFDLLVRPDRVAGVRVTYEVRLRGGGAVTLAFHDGALDAGPGRTARADCRISADPVAFLLVAYGRRSQWPAIATGKLTAWGRRPWWAFRLTSLLAPP
jgi:uncharacterized protein (TIGR03083 family)